MRHQPVETRAKTSRTAQRRSQGPSAQCPYGSTPAMFVPPRGPPEDWPYKSSDLNRVPRPVQWNRAADTNRRKEPGRTQLNQRTYVQPPWVTRAARRATYLPRAQTPRERVPRPCPSRGACRALYPPSLCPPRTAAGRNVLGRSRSKSLERPAVAVTKRKDGASRDGDCRASRIPCPFRQTTSALHETLVRSRLAALCRSCEDARPTGRRRD